MDAGFKLTYHDLGNTIHFSIFTMHTFPPSQKITISEYNAVSQSETEKYVVTCLRENNFLSFFDLVTVKAKQFNIFC